MFIGIIIMMMMIIIIIIIRLLRDDSEKINSELPPLRDPTELAKVVGFGTTININHTKHTTINTHTDNIHNNKQLNNKHIH